MKYDSLNANFKPYVALSRNQTKGPKTVKVQDINQQWNEGTASDTNVKEFWLVYYRWRQIERQTHTTLSKKMMQNGRKY